MKTLLYYIYDIDSNLLYMSTPLHIDILINNEWTPKDIFPDEFSKIRTGNKWRCRNNDSNLTYEEFSDIGPRGDSAFLEDVKKAISTKSFGPSFYDFINTLINGNIFLIITARGHEPETLKNFVKWIINDFMTQQQRDEMRINLKKFQKLFDSVDDSIESYLNTLRVL